jgi:hypothetical protein
MGALSSRRPQPRPRLHEHELTPLQVAGLALCRAIYNADCDCFDKRHVPSSCNAIRERAGQMLAKIVAAQARVPS